MCEGAVGLPHGGAVGFKDVTTDSVQEAAAH